MKEHHPSLAEILAALSHALDLSEGQRDGHTVRSCLIGMRLGRALGLDAEPRANLFYALLLKDAGGSANAAPLARRFGSDDRALKRDFKTTDWPRLLPAALYGIRNAATGRPLIQRVIGVARLGMGGPYTGRELVRMRGERGAEIVGQLGLPEEAAAAVFALDEHWDGEGHPDGLRGEDIPLLARIAGLAQTVDAFVSAHGVGAAMEVLAERRGRWFEPRLVDEVLGWAGDDRWWRLVRGPEAEAAVLDGEPPERARRLDEEGLDGVAGAFARIIDAKSAYTSSHSRRVARYAVAIAGEMGLPGPLRCDLHRAGLLHDIGKLGVSNRILDKAGPLTARERARVQRHPAHGWRILKRARAFRSFAWPAVLHHERLDGSGYPWGIDGTELDLTTRILSVADVFEALTAKRPYRAPMAPTAALAVLRRECGAGYDPRVVDALEAVALRNADAVLGAA